MAQLFKSNWPRSLSAIDKIISQRPASGPSLMTTTFHESSCGKTEIAKSVGHPQMSSISILIADSSSSRVFAGFFKCVGFCRKTGDHCLWLSCARACRAAGVKPLAIRDRRRTSNGGQWPLKVKGLAEKLFPSSRGRAYVRVSCQPQCPMDWN